MPEFKFKVLDYRPATKPGIVQARLAIEDDRGVQFLDCAYFQKSDAAWIAPPARPLPLQDGAPAGPIAEYAQLIGFASPAVRKAWQPAAMQALREFLDSQPAPGDEQEEMWRDGDWGRS